MVPLAPKIRQLRVHCETCHGTGKVWSGLYCMVCDGAGDFEVSEVIHAPQ